LEEPDDAPKWSHVAHYFMGFQEKERAKALLQFQQVPFYVVFDETGNIVHSATNKLDWETHVLPFTKEADAVDEVEAPAVSIPASPEPHKNLRSTAATSTINKKEVPSPNSVFIVDDDLDF
jgi:hypothetical protein